MSTAPLVPVYDPQGNRGMIPSDQLTAAVKAGGKPGVNITAPDGTPGTVPADRYLDAVKAGAKVQPLEQQPIAPWWKEAGKTLWDNITGIPKALAAPDPMAQGSPIAKMLGDTSTPLSDDEKWKLYSQQTAAKDAQSAERVKEHGHLYDLGASAMEMIGDPVAQQEQAAKEGNPGKVIGSAATVPAVAAATAGATRAAGEVAAAAPSLEDVTRTVQNVTPKQAGQALGAATGAGLGHGTLSAPGAYYGAKTGGGLAEGVLGTERANQPIFGGKGTNAPATQPEAPAPELIQGNALAQGAKPAVSQSDALASIPNKTIMELPPKAVNQALQELGPKTSLSELTERANNIAKLGDLLNQGLGGKELEPNVPLKNQGIVTPKQTAGTAAGASRDTGIMAQVKSEHPEWTLSQQLQEAAKRAKPSDLPAGHIPVESSALKSFKYDPQTQEFESVTQTGAHYIHGDVSPEQAAAFESASSKGKAWNTLRQNSTLVAKVVNGKRVPVKPVISPEDSISDEEWQHGHELETAIEGSQR